MGPCGALSGSPLGASAGPDEMVPVLSTFDCCCFSLVGEGTLVSMVSVRFSMSTVMIFVAVCAVTSVGAWEWACSLGKTPSCFAHSPVVQGPGRRWWWCGEDACCVLEEKKDFGPRRQLGLLYNWAQTDRTVPISIRRHQASGCLRQEALASWHSTTHRRFARLLTTTFQIHVLKLPAGGACGCLGRYTIPVLSCFTHPRREKQIVKEWLLLSTSRLARRWQTTRHHAGDFSFPPPDLSVCPASSRCGSDKSES